MRQVLVSGATGYLGKTIIHRLIDAGMRPIAVARSASKAESLRGLDVPVFVADLGTGEGIFDALEGVDSVIHCAGGGWAKARNDFYLNNTRTAELVATVLRRRETPLRRFVFLSSVSAHGPHDSLDECALDSPDQPLSDYGRSKLAAEGALARLLPAESSLVSLRPPAIYGPGDIRLLPLFRAVQRSIAPLPAGAGTTSVLHVHDLASGVLAALDMETDGHATHYITDGNSYAWSDIIAKIGELMGRQPRQLSLPKPLLNVAAGLNEFRARVTDRPALLTKDKLKDMTAANWVFDSSKFREAANWKPEYDLEKGLQSTLQDYWDRGWLKQDNA